MDFGSGIAFEGELGSITCMRGGLKIEPKELRALGPEDQRLYESKDHFRNFIDAIQDGVNGGADGNRAPLRSPSRTWPTSPCACGGKTLRWDPQADAVLGRRRGGCDARPSHARPLEAGVKGSAQRCPKQGALQRA
jgi:hypothetical protein